jgi:hypothetical protein
LLSARFRKINVFHKPTGIAPPFFMKVTLITEHVGMVSIAVLQSIISLLAIRALSVWRWGGGLVTDLFKLVFQLRHFRIQSKGAYDLGYGPFDIGPNRGNRGR